MILMRVIQRYTWETPQEFLDLVKQEIAEFVEAKDEVLICENVRTIRDFDTWLKTPGVTLKNAFLPREGRSVPHSFTYKVRNDLTPSELSAVPGRKPKSFHTDGEDVFAVVKGRMHMTKCQNPVLAFPQCLLKDMSGVVPDKCLVPEPLKEPRKNELLKLAEILEFKVADPYPKAAEAIRNLVHAPDRAPAPLPWLSQDGWTRTPVDMTSNPYYEHLPDTSWNLLASFSRKATRPR